MMHFCDNLSQICIVFHVPSRKWDFICEKLGIILDFFTGNTIKVFYIFVQLETKYLSCIFATLVAFLRLISGITCRNRAGFLAGSLPFPRPVRTLSLTHTRSVNPAFTAGNTLVVSEKAIPSVKKFLFCRELNLHLPRDLLSSHF